ncbi:hypothetical protein JP75_02065 [Devosia riboflavina]|uniref:Amidase domain-containing protein n=2 Tax=Devosia riboflavina TaxID=46914 RepID=A0A087M7T6_9HYPH|nr:hypothetical protein JP75_02065 [Devosia riboflavina]
MGAETDSPLWQLPATTLARRFADGSLQPSMVLEAILARTDTIDAALNVMALRDDEGARAMAGASDRRWAEGRPLSELDGVPIAIKDNIPVAGLPCAWGSKLFLDFVPERDELAVDRLRRQGLVLLGKTTVSEFTLGRGNVDTPAFGTTRNPWNPALTTGASTGGGAAAVASGVAPFGLGTDGGGSIRWPASYCGLVGFKPSTGRIPRRFGLPAVLNDLEVLSPISRTVDDAAALLQALSEPDVHDRASMAFRHTALVEEPARPLRILHVSQFGNYPVEPEITASVNLAADQLRAMGHRVEAGTAPFDFGLFDRHWRTITMTGVAAIMDGRENWENEVGAIYPSMVADGRAFSSRDYLAALNAYRSVFEQLTDFFEDFDLLLTPVAGAMPRPANEIAPPYQRVFTGFANVTGIPAVSLPGPRSHAGIPIGFQLIAPFGGEGRLLTIARAYEHAHPWAGLWPSLNAS